MNNLTTQSDVGQTAKHGAANEQHPVIFDKNTKEQMTMKEIKQMRENYIYCADRDRRICQNQIERLGQI